MAFLQHYSMDQTLQEGQWASDLDQSLQEVLCASMAGPPTPRPFPPPLPDTSGRIGGETQAPWFLSAATHRGPMLYTRSMVQVWNFFNCRRSCLHVVSS